MVKQNNKNKNRISKEPRYLFNHIWGKNWMMNMKEIIKIFNHKKWCLHVVSKLSLFRLQIYDCNLLLTSISVFLFGQIMVLKFSSASVIFKPSLEHCLFLNLIWMH